jgi:aminomethyltransferase
MNVIGVVTSGTQSPSLGKPIGMAYVPSAQSKPGSEILINIRGKAIKGVVTKIPFLQA